MVKRWVAAGMLNAERGFRWVRGCKDMPTLLAALPRHAETVTPKRIMRKSHNNKIGPSPNFNRVRDTLGSWRLGVLVDGAWMASWDCGACAMQPGEGNPPAAAAILRRSVDSVR